MQYVVQGATLWGMSKQVRLSKDVSVRVDALAVSERRSFANMVEVLLLGALDGGLAERDQGRREVAAGLGAAVPAVSGGSGSTAPLSSSGDSSPRSASPSVRAHMKKHRPAVQCATLVEAGECPDCGTIVDNA